MAKGKHKKKKDKKKHKGNSTKAMVGANKPIKHQMSKRMLIDHLTTSVDELTGKLSTRETKQLVTATLDSLIEAMQRSLMPKGVGTFIFPKVMKVSLKTKPAIKKGTMVRSPATGGMVPSKGRPASKQVKVRPLTSLKKAAAGEIA